jgi:hypothetical protein
MIIQRGFVAVRRDAFDGRKWFHMDTWSGHAVSALKKAREAERLLPCLKVESPVILIQPVAVQADGDSLVVRPDGRLAVDIRIEVDDQDPQGVQP